MMQVCDISVSLAGSVKMALAQRGLGSGGAEVSENFRKNLILIVELMFGLSQGAY